MTSAPASSSGNGSEYLYLGIDSSTQSFKITAIDSHKRILQQVSVSFEQELPEFRTKAGIVRNDYGFGPLPAPAAGAETVGEVITSPSLMFVAALDKALTKLAATGLPLRKVRAVSVSGQQHGSVYWQKGAAELLQALRGDKDAPALAEQLKDAFSVPFGPIWMDSSTGAQCRALEAAVGGAQALATLTGSSAYERFTGNQIAKVSALLPDAWGRTDRVSLVSSMIPSLLLGRYAPIDASDAAGMNLMDLNCSQLPFEWSDKLLEATLPKAHGGGGAEELKQKLGAIVDSAASLGEIAPYFQTRYGFDPLCAVVAGSGDNPCSLVGLGLARAGDLGVSLGTSDTLIALTHTASTHPRAELGHVFPAPLDVIHERMLMLCFKNGSLAREQVRDQALPPAATSSAASAATSWTEFNSALASTPPGNEGHFFFAFCEHEIVPHTRAAGYFAFAPAGADGTEAPVLHTAASGAGNAASQLGARAIRGVLESQFLNMLLQARRLGMTVGPRKIIATGGASTNLPLLQILADVLGADVEAHALVDAASGEPLGQLSDTASLGAALRALHSVTERDAYAASAAGAASPSAPKASEPTVPSSPLSVEVTQGAKLITRTKLASVRPEVHQLYLSLLPRFEKLQNIAVQQLNQ